MPCYRYYYPGDLACQSLCLEDHQEVHHMRKVMRVHENEQIELINGKGQLATGMVKTFLKDRVEIEVLSCQLAAPPKVEVTLYLAVLKPSHLEYALEKATEVGAFGFELFFAQKSEKKEISSQYKTRLQEIVKNACKQCGRLYIPEISVAKDLESCLKKPIYSLFYGCMQGSSLLPTLSQKVGLFIGPESGFSQNEKELLILKKAHPISLHPNTLRAETAAIIGTYAFFCHETAS